MLLLCVKQLHMVKMWCTIVEMGFFLFHFHWGGVKVLAYLNKYNQCTSTPTGKLSALILTCGASLGQVENNKSEPLNLHSLSPYHSRQIVFTPDPTTATKDPTCSSNNSKSNHIGFPFLVSKGHSLSWFFSFNSCTGIDPPPLYQPPHHNTPTLTLYLLVRVGEETEDYRFALKQWANLKSPNELSLIIEIIRH